MNLLLLHGAGACGAVWDELRPLLPGLVAAPDLPGHGDAPDAGPPSLAAYADALADQPCDVLIGHSMGAAVALHLALRAPARVRALVLIGGGLRFRVGAHVLAALHASTEDQRAFFSAACFGPQAAAELVASARERIVAASPERVVGDMALLDGLDLRARAAELTMPVLFLQGEHDALMPVKLAHEGATLVPDGRAVILDGIGHNAMMEAPERCASAIRERLG